MPNGSTLTVNGICVGSGGGPFTGAAVVSGVTANLPVNKPAAPSISLNTATVSWVVQPGGDYQDANGFAHISVTGLTAGATFTDLQLADAAGNFWRPNAGIYENVENLFVTNNGTSADLAFQPVRDETGTPMTLRFARSNAPATTFVNDLGGRFFDINLRNPGAVVLNQAPIQVYSTSTMNQVRYVDGGGTSHYVDVQSLLDMAKPSSSPRYTQFVFNDGVYNFNKTIVANSGLKMKGTSTNVEFRFNFVQGYSYNSAIAYNSSHVTIDGLKIRFSNPTDLNAAVPLSAPTGVPVTNPSTSDYNFSGGVIGNAVYLSQTPYIDVNILNCDIQAVADTQAPIDMQTAQQTIYVAMNLVRSGYYDSGTIAGNLLLGGTVQLMRGPWQLQGNRHIGALPGTISIAAFGILSGHDVNLSGNYISNAGSIPGYLTGGMTTGLFTANVTGYDMIVSGNHVSDNVGLVPTNPGGSNAEDNPNHPEIMLLEGYAEQFEGGLAAAVVSTDRRLVTLPTALYRGYGPGVGGVVTILDGNSAGAWFSIAQVVASMSSGANPTALTTLVLANPLPAGNFAFSVSTGYTGLVIDANEIDVSGTVSCALVLSSSQFGASVTNNVFKGDGTYNMQFNGVQFSKAMRIDLSPSNGGTGRLASTDPMAGVVISGNTIENSIGGVSIARGSDTNSSYGRTYGLFQFTNNNFIYSTTYQPFTNPSQGNKLHTPHLLRYGNDGYYSTVSGNGTVQPNAQALGFDDPYALRITASGNSVQWGAGVTPPSNSQYTGAATINSSLVENQNAAIPMSTAVVRTGISAVSRGQDGSDFVGQGPTAGPDGIVDVHVALANLPANLTITRIDITPYGGGWAYQYLASGSPASVWAAALRRGANSSTADLYFSPDPGYVKTGYEPNDGHAPGGAAYMANHYDIAIYFSDNSTAQPAVYGVQDNPNVTVPTPAIIPLNQDGHDYVGTGTTAAPDGVQDVHFAISGLRPDKAISRVEVHPWGYGNFEYVAPGVTDPHASWARALLIRPATGALTASTTADLYVQPIAYESGYSHWDVAIYYADGTVWAPSVYGIKADPTLAVGAISPGVSAVSRGQDGSDFVGQGPTAGPDGIVDVHVALANLPANLTITRIDITPYGGGWAYQYLASGSPASVWAAALRRGANSSTADLYFSPDPGYVKTGYEPNDGHAPGGAAYMANHYDIAIYFSDNSTAQPAVYGVQDNPNVTVPTPAIIPLNQDGHDYVGTGTTAAPDGVQDVHFAISGLRPDKAISRVEVHPWGYGNFEYVAPGVTDPHASWARALLIRPATGALTASTTADLYVQPIAYESGYSHWDVTIYYADGTVWAPPVYGIQADPTLAAGGGGGSPFSALRADAGPSSSVSPAASTSPLGVTTSIVAPNEESATPSVEPFAPSRRNAAWSRSSTSSTAGHSTVPGEKSNLEVFIAPVTSSAPSLTMHDLALQSLGLNVSERRRRGQLVG